MDDYRTISGRATAELEEKRSRFIGLAAFADTEQKALDILAGVRAAHRTARHNVYAYSLREGARLRYSDDGEPAKTAGLPVLEAIRHAGLTNCIVVVTRYFGGTLLGTGGLVRAYTAAAAGALAAAKVVTVRSCVRLTVTVSYALYEQAAALLAGAGAACEEPVFADAVTLTALLPAGAEQPLLPKIAELTRGTAPVELSPPFYAPL